ncbi:ABC transporter permease [Chitinophaga sp. Ak27]|uniref:ABC transporter permease n=1 Tax=Chitinophaga sp. Ak27 TaxID=2726116 RepID=UPI00145E25AC|nr:ABC transporter permease [Chitinophaga sp. Ak27]NLU93262.1 hypothetical protein [Chitinophaga sp. Ak27]
MLKRNIIYAWRNLIHRNFIGLANIVLLALVTATVLHLLKYIAFEKSFDKFHANAKNLYRIQTELVASDETTEYATSLGLTADLMKRTISGVKDYVNLTPLSDGCTIVYKNIVYRENRVFEVDSTFFNIFSFPLVKGDPSEVLKKPNTVVLTESAARKYFNGEDPIGKTVKIKGKYATFLFEITGICKDFPANSHIQMDWICSNHHLFKIPEQFYSFRLSMNHWTYLLLNDNTNIKMVEDKTNEELAKMEIYKTAAVRIKLQPMGMIHLKSQLQNEIVGSEGGYEQTILLLELIGIICFVITYLNFINISLVKTIGRAREVGIRTMMGATLRDNMMIFFAEAILQIGIALVLSMLIYLVTAGLVARYFNFPHNYRIGAASYWFYLAIFLSFIFFTILVSLLYAFIFSRVKPINIIKRGDKILSRRITLKSVPIIIQFTICIFFLSFTQVVFKQVSYILNKDMGYNRENIIFIPQPHLEDIGSVTSKMEAFDQEAKSLPDVVSITRSVYGPGSNGYAQWGGVSNDKIGKDTYIMFAHNEVMYNFFDLYGMKLLAGSFFSKESDKDDIVVNYTACRKLGYQKPEDIVGQMVFVKHKRVNKKVVGVVADFNQESLKFKIEPVIFHLERENMRHTTTVKISPHSSASTIGSLRQIWGRIFPESEFVYSVFTEDFKTLYTSEINLQKWLKFFCGLTLLICSFCIFMITYYAFKESEKEIAIHKVLGAGLFDIMKLSRNFLRFMAISLTVGFIFSGIVSGKWLSNYAYHIGIDVWFFLLPTVIVVLFFLLTLTYSLYRTVSVNPVTALRSE